MAEWYKPEEKAPVFGDHVTVKYTDKYERERTRIAYLNHAYPDNATNYYKSLWFFVVNEDDEQALKFTEVTEWTPELIDIEEPGEEIFVVGDMEGNIITYEFEGAQYATPVKL